MKKIIILLIAASLVFSLASCGETASDVKEDGEEVNTSAETQRETEEATEEVTDTASDVTDNTEPDFEGLSKQLKDQLVGNWTFYNRMYQTTSNHLVFNADGTGSYQGGVIEDGKYEFDYTFTYTISFEQNEDNSEYYSAMLTVQYNEIDDSETRQFFFWDDGSLHLPYGDKWIIQYDEYVREESVTTQS